MKKIAILAVTAAATLMSSPAFAATEFVKNGDFSMTTAGTAPSSTASTTVKNAYNSGNFQLGSTYGSVANWSTSGGYNLLYNASNATSAAGNAYGTYSSTGAEYLNSMPAGTTGKFLALDGDTAFATAVTQTISGLVAGQWYTLQFDWSASSIASRTGAKTDGITASINGQSFNTGELPVPSGWQHASYNFLYSSTGGNVLSFLSHGTPSGQPPVALLDNVSLTAAVPEPATWAMMLLGFGMVGAASRYRRRKTSVAIA